MALFYPFTTTFHMLYRRKQFNLSLYSKGGAHYRERMIQKVTFFFNFMPYTCLNLALPFLKRRWVSSISTVQHSLA